MKKNNIEFQLSLLKEYGVVNLKYTIEKNKLVIDQGLYLNVTKVHKDFLKHVRINGCLFLTALISYHKDFLKYTTISAWLFLNSSASCHKDFLKNPMLNIIYI